jgi:hypothetical protein
MRYIAPVLVGLTSLGSCQAPATTGPATLVGHWACDTATSVVLDHAGQPTGAADSSQIGSQVLVVTPTRLLMPEVTPGGDTTEWTYTRRQDTLFVQYVRLQGRPFSLADVWRVAKLTPATFVLERTIQDEGEPYPHRYRWHYHRMPRD